MKKMIILVVVLAITIIYLIIALISVRTEMVNVKLELSQSSVRAECWERSFYAFYWHGKQEWRGAKPYAELAILDSFSQVYARELDWTEEQRIKWQFLLGPYFVKEQLGE